MCRSIMCRDREALGGIAVPVEVNTAMFAYEIQGRLPWRVFGATVTLSVLLASCGGPVSGNDGGEACGGRPLDQCVQVASTAWAGQFATETPQSPGAMIPNTGTESVGLSEPTAWAVLDAPTKTLEPGVFMFTVNAVNDGLGTKIDVVNGGDGVFVVILADGT